MIELKKVSKRYCGKKGNVLALDALDLNIERGEFVSIVGHSGSGKTTLMNIIGCLDSPTEGEYCFEGEAINYSDHERNSHIRNSKIGFVFQSFHLIPRLTALENVALTLVFAGMEKKKRENLATKALEEVGLSDRKDHIPSELSGGQQQRVAIARAISFSPPVILADEPTGNLDRQSAEEILRVLEALHSDGRTVLLITHDEQIAKRGSRMIRMTEGRITEDRLI